MAGLFGESWDDPRTIATLQLAGGLLGGGNLGEALGRGLSGYQDSLFKSKEMKRREEEAGLLKEQRQAEIEARKLALEQSKQAAAVRQFLPNIFQQTPAQVGFDTSSGIPMTTQPITTPAGPRALSQEMIDRALRMGATPEQIKAYADLQNLGKEEVKQFLETEGPDGTKRMVPVSRYGQPLGEGMAGYVPPVQVNQGTQTTFVTPRPGVSLPIGMSPAERDASARGWAGLAQPTFNAEAGGFVYKPTQAAPQGGFVPVSGFPQGAKNISEGERKAGSLLQRLEFSMGQLQSAIDPKLGGEASSARPGALAETLRRVPLAGDLLANVANPQTRQRVEAAQLDMLDAALTLGTGAAYTREQLEGYRKAYFPQIGDDPQTVKDKQARLSNVINAAKIAAGRAAGSATMTPATINNNDPLGLFK